MVRAVATHRAPATHRAAASHRVAPGTLPGTPVPPQAGPAFLMYGSSAITDTAANVTWGCDMYCTGYVRYASDAYYVANGDYQLETAHETSFSWGLYPTAPHLQTLAGLAPGTLYHWQPVSSGPSTGPIETRGADQTLTTTGSPPGSGGTGSGSTFPNYGTWMMNGLGELNFNSAANECSVRFRAAYTGLITGITWYQQNTGDGRYGDGDGGVLRVTLEADDGTSNHRPAGAFGGGGTVDGLTILGRCPDYTDGGNRYEFHHSILNTPVAVTAGTLLHFRFHNYAPSPTDNWNSLNCTVDESYPGTPVKITEADFDVLYFNNGRWDPNVAGTGGSNDHDHYSPIVAIAYADGRYQGQTYMEATPESPWVIGGSNMVRMRITPSDITRTVDGVWVKCSVNSGSSPLIMRLENSDGSLIESVSTASSAFTVGSARAIAVDTVWVPFASHHVLAVGTSYNLVWTSAGDYRTMRINSGHSHWGLPIQCEMNGDGVPGYSTNSGSSWTTLGGEEFQFIFRVLP